MRLSDRAASPILPVPRAPCPFSAFPDPRWPIPDGPPPAPDGPSPIPLPSGMFVDQAVITVEAGKGGDGCVSFFRGKYVPKGGPDGGNGGRGGSIYFFADPGLNTLFDFRGRPLWTAPGGEPGQGKQCFGRDAEDVTIKVPPGTMVFDADTGELIADLKPDETALIAKGGRGGFGNEHFKSSTHQAPLIASPGQQGERRNLRLELKLIADIGFVGLPNAGKSTLLKSLTRANPKIGNYPFTTRSPHLGVAELDQDRRLVLADLPGLIEGASEGAGLGHDFLRHIERTRVLLHLVDALPPDGKSPAENYRMIREELAGYASALAEKPEVVALNKLDLLPTDAERDEALARFRAEVQLGVDTPVLAVSGAAGHGLNTLLEELWKLHAAGRNATPPPWQPVRAPDA